MGEQHKKRRTCFVLRNIVPIISYILQVLLCLINCLLGDIFDDNDEEGVHVFCIDKGHFQVYFQCRPNTLSIPPPRYPSNRALIPPNYDH
ncbi:hypothetical protein L1887_24097 [Cichorium endivia]|nr:hypothetical protein L1887_24097 [Cichorium endivia]